jgi:leader peptidase (prepilin peptidase)/N-methyltransferase
VLVVADLPEWFLRTMALVFGGLWGSFFNVAIYRWPREMSVVSPPSHCPACGAQVRWYLNVPILGYALLKGRAGCCGAPMTSRYVWVEAISAVLCLAIVERFVVQAAGGDPLGGAVLEALCYFIFVGGLIIATFVDMEWIEIPDEVTLPGTALGLVTVTLRGAPGPLDAALGAGFGFLVVQVLFVWVYEALTGRRGMGEGDAKLLMMIGAFLGWEAVLFCLIAGSFQGLIAAAILRLTGQPLVPTRPDEGEAASAKEPPENGGDAEEEPASSEDKGSFEDSLPNAPMLVFGPLLSLAAIEYLFFGDTLVAMYLDLFRG